MIDMMDSWATAQSFQYEMVAGLHTFLHPADWSLRFPFCTTDRIQYLPHSEYQEFMTPTSLEDDMQEDPLSDSLTALKTIRTVRKSSFCR